MNLSFNYLLLSVSLIGTPVLILLFRVMALKIGLMDHPEKRKIHDGPIPLVGGLTLFTMSVVLLLIMDGDDDFASYLLIATSMVVLVGLLDDLFQLSASWRFAVQIVASLMLIYFTNVQLFGFGELLFPGWNLNLSFMAIPVTVFGVVGVINAINMADGIDGLAAMTFFMPVFTLVILVEPSIFSIWLLYLLICLLIFVVFNQSTKFKVFLGDNGSMFLGFILAWILVLYSQANLYHKPIIYPVTALYLVGFPIIDTIYVMLRRILAGQSPFKPDNTHLHHMFLLLGYGQGKSLLFVLILQALMIGVGVLFLYYRLSEYVQFYIFVAISFIYYLFMRSKWQRMIDGVNQ